MQAEERPVIVSMCQQIHKKVQTASEAFHKELGRMNYVTPTSYLELISMFQTLLESKRADNRRVRHRCAPP